MYGGNNTMANTKNKSMMSEISAASRSVFKDMDKGVLGAKQLEKASKNVFDERRRK